MIKRNTPFVLLFWLGRSAGIVLLLWEIALIALLLGSWTSSTLPEKFTLLFFIVWSLPLAFSLWRVPRQRLRTETMRMHMDEAPLFTQQPAYEHADLPVPTVLSMKLSRHLALLFAVFWLLMLGIVLLFQASRLLAWGILWHAIIGWLILGALVFGLSALALYQRIEITDKMLLVQRGWRRGRIPWSEARLFAVLSLDEKARARADYYELSSARTILRWTHVAPAGGFTLSPRNREEYMRLLEELRVFIRVKTGLMVRDLR